MKAPKLFCGVLVSMVATTLGAGAASAQHLDDFTISGEAAVRAKARDEISLATARQIVDHCLENAASRDMGVSIFILSPAGDTVFAARADGQGPVNIETARMKAETALYMRDSTHRWMNILSQREGFDIRLLPLNQFWNSGGLPIVVDDVMIGVIGVGGMPASAEWSDEICAHEAMTAVLGPQPPLAAFMEE